MKSHLGWKGWDFILITHGRQETSIVHEFEYHFHSTAKELICCGMIEMVNCKPACKFLDSGLQLRTNSHLESSWFKLLVHNPTAYNQGCGIITVQYDSQHYNVQGIVDGSESDTTLILEFSFLLSPPHSANLTLWERRRENVGPIQPEWTSWRLLVHSWTVSKKLVHSPFIWIGL